MVTIRSEPNSTSLTLRLKHGKYTILLFAQPDTPFTTIKTDLLSILHERYPSGLLMGKSQTLTPIPTDITEVVLAEQTDTYDVEKGWTELDLGGNLRESPASLRVRDAAVLAFAFMGEGEEVEFWVESPNLEELYPEDG